jgi:STAS-like domain of unknown function (DUF4325)
MKTVKLSNFGVNLGTRFVGELARKAIGDALLGSKRVKVDFSGVSRISHSFADEVVGSLIAEMGLDDFKARLEFVGVSSDMQAVLRFVVSERIRRATL